MWHAKRTGGYSYPEQEYIDNVWEAYYLLSDASTTTPLSGDAWSLYAICGMLGNATAESGLNPWRWNSIGAYGLVQFYPSTYYIGGRGVGKSGYAPSTSPSASGDGANASDGKAQLLVVDDPSGTKYIYNQQRADKARDLDWSVLEWNSINAYKMCDSLEEATQAFLLFYEYPTTDLNELRAEYNTRKGYADTVYQILTGTPPIPPTPTSRGKMPLYMYTLKRYRMKRGLF